MAGLGSCRVEGFRCCSNSSNGDSEGAQTPQLLRIAVGAVTEFLRLFTPAGRERHVSVCVFSVFFFLVPWTVLVDDEWKDEISLSNVDDVLSIIRSDYEKAYFVTGTIFEVFEVVGLFTSAIYADECTFEDPTIKFQAITFVHLRLKAGE
ncbi:hypothetical protein Sango_2841800 [Sesamum angolense]|uniref:Uncharacterized protein n=1 Tax=Sesamum angolense TaxID=2727404 RepID=A0AAE1T6G1_9LAMI|nr:hypothetical protein Sango_2841800 [Sesamum angolense]